MMREDGNEKNMPADICYVRIRGKEARVLFVEFLEKNGYACEADGSTSREEVIKTRFPVAVDINRKLYGCLHNTVCAAAASSSRSLLSVEEFYELAEWMSPFIIV
ncbi:MAG: hypothetical protein IK128_01915 [Clostridiales bacterium]|nr:hypothetical protein [Clostridiales bacterium]